MKKLVSLIPCYMGNLFFTEMDVYRIKRQRKKKMRIKEKLIENKEKYGIVCFILVCFLMLMFFYAHSDNAFTGITGEKEPVKELQLKNGVELKQELPGKDAKLVSVSIRFGTHDNNNSGNVYVRLYENGHLLEEWDVKDLELENDTYHSFPLSSPKEMNQGFSYQVSIVGNYEGGSGAAVWMAKEKDRGCYVDGELLEKNVVCCQITYVNDSLKIWMCIIAALLFLAVGAAILCKINERAIMSGLLVAMGIVYFWVCPPGMMPDETNHFYRAFEISCGNWTSQHMGEDGGGGNYLPAALPDYQNPDVGIDWNNITELRYGNTSLYAPVSYLPQAIGIRIARFFTDNVSKIFYAGRFGNFLVSMLLCLWVVSMMPFGKRILFLIMMFPMSLQEMVSMAPDGFTIALSLAFLAYILRCCSNGEELKKKNLIIISLMGFVFSLCKIVYVVLLLLVFLLPKDKFENVKKEMIFKFGVPCAAFAVNLAWLKISSGYLIEFMPGVSSGEQVAYVLTHLPSYCMVIMRTIQAQGVDWMMQMIGNPLGALNIEISRIVWITILILFVYELCNCRDIKCKVCKIDCLILAFIFLSGSMLIFTSIYVQWTAVANRMVSGIQGRYFTPLLPCLALFMICASHIQEKKRGEIRIYQGHGSYFYMLLLMLHGITILDVIHYYI